MKNFEKYADELKKYDAKELCTKLIKPIILKKDNCPSNNCAMCCRLLMLWMGEEYKPEPPKVDWSKVEVDTPILVRDSENTEWLKKYFAKYENGHVYVWNLGRTSWTAPNNKSVSAWQYAKLAESEQPEVDWSEVEVDTPILVGEGDGDWVKRYFAEYKDGIVYAWCGGSTSWDANNMMMAWKYAKLAEDEEQK